MIVRVRGIFKIVKPLRGILEDPGTGHDFYTFTEVYPEKKFVADGYFLKGYQEWTKEELGDFYGFKKIELFVVLRW